MQRPWPVHLIALTVLVGLMFFVLQVVGDALPQRNADLLKGLIFSYAAFSLSALLIRAVLNSNRKAQLAQHLNDAMSVAGAVMVIAGFWLVAPYADQGVRLVLLVYKVGSMTIQVANAVEPPPSRRPRGLALFVLPISIALYFTVHWERLSPALIAFAIAYGFICFGLHRALQGAIDRAYAAQLATEGALAQVAAERDAREHFLGLAPRRLAEPLQAARDAFDQAQRASSEELRAAAAQRVRWGFRAIEHLLVQMLDHLRLDAGAVEPRPVRIQLGPVMAQVAKLNEPAARLAGVEIVAAPTRQRVMADTAMVQRALGNFVGNAIRHGQASRILIGARRRGGHVRVWVIDDGGEVAAADAARLLEPGVQGSDPPEGAPSGTRLEIAAARRMAELMGASVGLEPRWRKGAAFWLDLPLA
jgi:signal transduction histidine kinase